MSYNGSGGSGSTLINGTLRRAPSAKKPKAPCKYGPRTSDGKCPKKPASAKAPCKWGPRLANGKCPKKPKSLGAAFGRDLKAGVNPLAKGSSSRTVTEVAAEQTAARAVTKVARKLELAVKKNAGTWGTLGATLLRALIPVGAIIAATVYADRKFNELRRRDIERIAEQYKYTLASIPTTGGKYKAAQDKARIALATWLGRELEAVNSRYDKRTREE